MWKVLPNSFLRTFSKGLFKGDNSVLNAKAIDSRNFDLPFKFSPVLNNFSRYYGFCKDDCGKFENGKKRRGNPNEKKNDFLRGFEGNLLDALSWSGVLVLGYYFLQPFKKKHQRQIYENFNCPFLSLNYLNDALGFKTIHYVFPEVNAHKTKNVTKNLSPVESSLKPEKDTNVFEEAHQKVSGILNNWLGIQHMQSGNQSKALKFFNQSADKCNAAGIFNLGICYERGLGTSQNLERAAELYQRATDMGHPKAMYNLGVFYARGLGAVKVDIIKARQLFTAAAQLGQKDALKALTSELSTEKDLLSHEEKHIGDRTGDDFEDLISRLLFNDSLQESSDEDERCESSFNYSDSGALDLSPRMESDENAPMT